MKSIVRPRYVCRLCRANASSFTARYSTATATETSSSIQTSSNITSQAARTARATITSKKSSPVKQPQNFWENQWTIFSADNAALVKKAQEFANEILSSKTIPSEKETLNALQVIESAVRQLTYDAKYSANKPSDADTRSDTQVVNDDSAAGSLLSLDSKTSQAHPASVSIAVDLLSTLAHKLITYPSVYITQPILSVYISIQAALHRPQSFPSILDLYAYKPIPIPGTSDPIRYRNPNPNASTQAIPTDIANKAVDAAIQAKDLHLALEIIEMTFAAPAFRRNKVIKKALPPLSIFGIGLPGAALALSLQLPYVSDVPDPLSNVMIGFAGILTYGTAVGVLGFVAITTSNDQMERVTWIQGTPLRERWIREEERAALDRIAIAWGFKERDRWGDEEGNEWEELRDWVARRRMWVDRAELMDGME